MKNVYNCLAYSMLQFLSNAYIIENKWGYSYGCYIDRR